MSRFCNVPDAVIEQARQNLCRWGHTPLTWCLVKGLPGFSDEDLIAVYTQAWEHWSAACGLKITRVTDQARANILIGARTIDRQFGTLAEAELPCGNITPASQLRVWFDESESWVSAANPPQGRMDLLRVAIHEFGHSLGLSHNADGVTNAIMDPSVSTLRKLQPWDIAQIQARYGAPKPNDPDPDEEDPLAPGGDDFWADFIKRLMALLLEGAARYLNRKPARIEWPE